jgi:isopenicillin-N epimerase
MSRPRKSDLSHHWTLDPETAFLNHGSFGATPSAILEEQSRFRALMENDPVRFFEMAEGVAPKEPWLRKAVSGSSVQW